MKVSKNALKLLLVVAAVGLYGSFVIAGSMAKADSSTPPGHSRTAAANHGSTQTPAANQTARPVQSAGLFGETPEEAMRRSIGCIDCHKGIEDMHNGVINLGCIDCHGGDAHARAQGMQKGSAGYEDATPADGRSDRTR